jgi:cbb3-type cytochrome oxidase subunit 3
MMSRTLSAFHLPWLACVGLLLFLAVFVGAVLWIHRRGSREFYERLRELPLEEENAS